MARWVKPGEFLDGLRHAPLRRAKRRGTTAVTLCFLLMTVVGVLVWTPSVAAATPKSSFEWGPCPEQVPKEAADRVRCGVLTVPESRAVGRSSQRTIKLPVAVIASRSASPEPDPVVLPTMGGPGSSSLNGMWLFLEYDWATQDRDAIVIEQRGDAHAQPTLRCPELDPEHFFVDGRRLSRPEREAATSRAVRACHHRLAGEGIDLSAYTSTETAADLAELRRALGYDQWNLYGLSYGSRLALTVMRDQPTGLRSVILDGVYPPNVNIYQLTPSGFSQSVRAMARACAADAACHARYPDVEKQLLDLLDRARQSPIAVTVRARWSGAPVHLEIDDADIADGLFQALYDDDQTRALPFVIDQLERGNTDVVVPLAQQNLDWQNGLTMGLAMSEECAEELPFYDGSPAQAPDALSAYLIESRTRASCAEWPVAARPAIENEPVHSHIPALLLNGGRDPITPPSLGRIAAEGLSRHVFYEFPTTGHGAVWHVWSDRCPATIAGQFLSDPTRQPNPSCIASMRSGRFLTTDDVHPTPAVYRLNSEVVQDRDAVQLGVVAASLAAYVGALAYATVTLVRRDRRTPRWGAQSALAASVLNLSFTGGLAFVLLRTDPLILGFGVPTTARPALIAGGILALAATAVLAGVVLRSWLRRDGAVGHRVVLTVAAVASVAFGVWLLSRGLLFV